MERKPTGANNKTSIPGTQTSNEMAKANSIDFDDKGDYVFEDFKSIYDKSEQGIDKIIKILIYSRQSKKVATAKAHQMFK